MRLPKIVAELVELMGLPAVEALVGEYGGARLYVPALVDPEHRLSLLLGLENASKICVRYAGDRIEIPKCVGLERGRVHEAIRRDREVGMSTASVARKYRLTERGIRLIVNRDG